MTMKFRHALAAASVLLAALAAHAQDAPAKPPLPCARFSIASTDRYKDVVTALKLPLPPDLPGLIEGQFTFVGAGGIDSTKPCGIVFLAADELPQSKLAYFVLPVTKGAATIEKLSLVGAAPVEGQPDMAQIGDALCFRRTANYLVLYPGEPAIIQGLGNDVFTKDYSAKDTVLYTSVDLAALRSRAPKGYKDFIDNARKNAGGNAPDNLTTADARGRQIGEDMVFSLLEKIDTMSVAVMLNDATLHVTSTLSSFPKLARREFAKPILPEGALLTVHMVYPTAESAGWLHGFVKMIFDTDIPLGGAHLTDDQKAQTRTIVEDMSTVLVADSQSMAVESRDGYTVVTVVNQYTGDVDLPAAIKKGIGKLEDLAEAAGQPRDLAVDDLKSGGGIRIRDLHPGKDGPGAIFVTQKGKTAVITYSTNDLDGPSTVTLSPTEKISDLLSAKADLGATLAAIDRSPMSDELPIPPEQRKTLIEALKGKKASLSIAANAAGEIVINLDAPAELLKIATQTRTGQPPAPPPQ